MDKSFYKQWLNPYKLILIYLAPNSGTQIRILISFLATIISGGDENDEEK